MRLSSLLFAPLLSLDSATVTVHASAAAAISRRLQPVPKSKTLWRRLSEEPKPKTPVVSYGDTVTVSTVGSWRRHVRNDRAEGSSEEEDDEDEGDWIEFINSEKKGQGITYTAGTGFMVPGFDKAIMGKSLREGILMLNLLLKQSYDCIFYESDSVRS